MGSFLIGTGVTLVTFYIALIYGSIAIGLIGFAEPTVIEKLEINFRRDERVIRFLTFKQDKYAAEYAAKRRSVKSTKKED